MLEAIRDKLRSIYNQYLGRPAAILDIFKEQFGEENVDSDITTFEDFVDSLSSMTMGSFGITVLSASNEHGHYTIDRADYEANGRGKSILEYAPDLGIFDYLTPKLVQKLNLLDSYNIIVHFPSVRVTNEYDKYIDIKDLYVKVNISHLGRILEPFTMARATYTFAQFASGYAHSHLPRISKRTAGSWGYPCLGSGPIWQTQNTLCSSYDYELWGLFAFELSKYVTVESISGVPYIRLESVGKSNVQVFDDSLQYNASKELFTTRFMIDRFIKYYAEKGNFKIKFVNGQYHIGESINSFCIHASSAFLKWYNDSVQREPGFPSMPEMLSLNIIGGFIVSNGVIYTKGSYGRSIADAYEVEGNVLFDFKGEPVRLHIIIDQVTANNECILFSKSICSYIITEILNIINYRYGKRNGHKRKEEESDTCQKPYIV